MWDFLKKLFSRRNNEVTVMVLDDDEPEASRSFRLHSADVVRLTVLLVVISVVLTTLLFFLTPIGSLYQHQQDEALREEVLSVTERVFALQDSLDLRDQQLHDIRQLIIRNPDTTFQVEGGYDQVQSPGRGGVPDMANEMDMPVYELLSRDDIIYADTRRRSPEFPTSFPVDGRITQTFDPDNGHYGIDIAAISGTEFQAIADGSVIYAGWTLNYGYVVYLQHSDGYVSIYKHGESLFTSTGDMVMQGDILGTLGDRGALSFGSHLHLEIWKNGVAQSPQLYLTD
jgi:murein DD-endopeptidase MepM/ murein hydrolase activator NlpD